MICRNFFLTTLHINWRVGHFSFIFPSGWTCDQLSRDYTSRQPPYNVYKMGKFNLEFFVNCFIADRISSNIPSGYARVFSHFKLCTFLIHALYASKIDIKNFCRYFILIIYSCNRQFVIFWYDKLTILLNHP